MEIEHVETLYEGWGRLLLLSVRLADGTRATREVDDHGSAVVVLPYDVERGVAMLVRQPRAPVLLVGEPPMLEAAAGRLDRDDPEAEVRREALEECGLRLRTLEPVGRFWSMLAVSTERLHLYLAPYRAADRVAPGGGLAQEGEHIEVVELPLQTLFDLEAAGELPDLKTAYLVATLRTRLTQLARPIAT